MPARFQLGFISGAPGAGELILIFLVVLLLFGPRKLPGFARTLGNLMQQLRRASNDFRDQLMSVEDDISASVRSAVDDPSASDTYDSHDTGASDLDDAVADAIDVEIVTDEDGTDREDRPLAG